MLHREVNGCHLELLPLKVKNCIRNCIRESFLHCVSQNFKCSFSCFTFFLHFSVNPDELANALLLLFCFSFKHWTQTKLQVLFFMFWPDEIPTNTDVHALKMFFFLLLVKSETRWNCKIALFHASIFVFLQWGIAGLYYQSCKTFLYYFFPATTTKTTTTKSKMSHFRYFQWL